MFSINLMVSVVALVFGLPALQLIYISDISILASVLSNKTNKKNTMKSLIFIACFGLLLNIGVQACTHDGRTFTNGQEWVCSFE